MSESLYKQIKSKLHDYKWASFNDPTNLDRGMNTGKFYYELETEHIINIIRTCPHLIYQDKKQKLRLRLFLYVLVVLRNMSVKQIFNMWDFLENNSPDLPIYKTRTDKSLVYKYAKYFEDFFVHRWISFLEENNIY